MVADRARKILDVKQNATSDEIKQAYRRAASKHHPDKGGDAVKFREAKEAFDCLTTQKSTWGSRSKDGFKSYDDIFKAAAGSKYTASDFNKAYEEVFKRRFNKDERSFEEHDYESISDYTQIRVPVMLKDAFVGVSPKVKVDGFTEPAIVDLTGGEQDGTVLRISDHFQATFILDLTTDPKYKLDKVVESGSNANLISTVDVSAVKLICGGYIEFECVDGGIVSVRIPEGLQNGKLLKIKERGYWVSELCRARGDQYLRVNAVIHSLEECTLADFKTLSSKLLEIVQKREGKSGEFKEST